jgi:hypothetical protein
LIILFGCKQTVDIFGQQSTNIMAKDKNKKTRCPKKYRLTAQEVAEMVGCSVSYVKQLRVGAVNNASPLARQVLAVDLLAKDGGNALVKEIERIVTLPTL